MRRMLHGDIVAAARVLLLVPDEDRQELCQQMIEDAEQANDHFETHGKPHPVWGTGSLMSAALQRPAAAEPSLDSLNYLSCLRLVMRELFIHRMVKLRSAHS